MTDKVRTLHPTTEALAAARRLRDQGPTERAMNAISQITHACDDTRCKSEEELVAKAAHHLDLAEQQFALAQQINEPEDRLIFLTMAGRSAQCALIYRAAARQCSI